MLTVARQFVSAESVSLLAILAQVDTFRVVVTRHTVRRTLCTDTIRYDYLLLNTNLHNTNSHLITSFVSYR